MRFPSRRLLVCCFLVLALRVSHAQSGLSVSAEALPPAGLNDFTPFQHSDIDSVNLNSGNVNVHVPLIAFPQKGNKLRLNFVVRYNEPQWSFNVTNIDQNTAVGTTYYGNWMLGNGFSQRPLGVDIVRDQAITYTQSLAFYPCIGNEGDYISCDDPYNGDTVDSTYSTTYNLRDRTGAEHPIGEEFSFAPLLGSFGVSGVYPPVAADGSGWAPQISAPGAQPTGFIDRNGVNYAYNPVTVYNGIAYITAGTYTVSDAHSNQIVTTASGWTDSAGRTIPGSWSGPGSGLIAGGGYEWGPKEDDPFPGVGTTDFSTCNSKLGSGTTGARYWDVPYQDGSTARYWFCFKDQTDTTAFGTVVVNGVTAGSSEATVTGRLLAAVILPNSTAYKFTYDSQFFDLTKIEFPTGGYASYTWETVDWDLCNTGAPRKRVVKTRTLNDGTTSNTWTYTWSHSGACGVGVGFGGGLSVIVSRPDGNDEYHVYSMSSGQTIYFSGASTGNPNSPVGTGTTVVKTVATTAEVFLSPFFAPIAPVPNGSGGWINMNTYQERFAGPITQIVTTLDDGSVSEVDSTLVPNGGSLVYEDPAYNYWFAPSNPWDRGGTCTCINYPEIAEVDEYDYGSGSHGALLRKTTTAYAFNNGTTSAPTYLAANLIDIPTSTTVQDGSSNQIQNTYAYDETSSVSSITLSSGAIAGEQTTNSVWDGGTWRASHTAYNSSGEALAKIDPANIVTMKVNAFDCSGLYPSQIYLDAGSAIQESKSYTHDCTSGHIKTYTDPNSKTITYTYSDSGNLNRLTNVAYPDAGSVSIAYTDGSSSSVQLTTAMNGSSNMVQSAHYDGLGRTISVHAEAPEGTIYQDTIYDSMGRVYQKSNPYRSGDTLYWTTTTYDPLSRPSAANEQDGSAKSWSYSGSSVTSTDEALNKTTIATDVIGRTTDVYEPTANNSTGTPLHTHYQYNIYGLKEVDQYGNGTTDAARIRRFIYDGMGRLTNVCNPEGLLSGQTCDGSHWSMTYAYLTSGSFCAGDLSLPCSKTDSRSVTTGYQYDTMNRLTQKNYTDSTPTVSLSYDQSSWRSSTLANTVGRLSGISAGSSSQGYSYDAMGRLTFSPEAFPDETAPYQHSRNFSYDLAGHVTDIWYPRTLATGPHIQQTFDSAGRLTKVYQGSGTSEIDYLTSVTFFPDGSPTTYTYGNGVTETFSHNSRLEITAINATNGASFALMDRSYSYSPSDGLSGSCVSSSGTRNTGNIWKIADNLPLGAPTGNWTRLFQYDCLNRLTYANIGGRTFGYGQGSFGFTDSSIGNNRLSFLDCHVTGGWADYDNAGNQTCDTDRAGGYRLYAYDGEERMASIATSGNPTSPFVTYVYDGNGMRVRKSNSDGTWTEYEWNGSEVLGEKDQDGHWTDYIYAGGKKIAKVDWEDAPLHISGHNCSSCGGTASYVQLTTGAGHLIQSGDVLHFTQYNVAPAWGGLILTFSDGSATSGTVAQDQLSQQINCASTSGSLYTRNVDLSAYAGKTLSSTLVVDDVCSPAGDFDLYFNDIAILSTDGTVTQIYEPHPGRTYTMIDANPPWPGPVTSMRAVAEHNSYLDATTSAKQATHYYLDDHLGTTQMELASNGWPIWYGQFTPYGMDITDTGTTSFKYKFTDKERDPESGLDYFGARYYDSSNNVPVSLFGHHYIWHYEMGRWMSPDWSAKAEPVPYSKLEDPQSLNLYAYARNNPVSRVDVDGHRNATYSQITIMNYWDFVSDSVEAWALSSQADSKRDQQQRTQTTANVVYNETAGLADAAGLHDGRVAEATVFDHHPGAFNKSERKLTAEQKKKIATDPNAKAVMADSLAAATEAVGRSDIGNHAITWDPLANIPHVTWMNTAYATELFGPFLNIAGGGAVPRGDETYIVIMQDLTYKEKMNVQ